MMCAEISQNQSICLVCYSFFEKFVTPPYRVWQKIFSSCSKHLHSIITKDRSSGTDKWETLLGRNNEDTLSTPPFCQQCFNSALELCQLADQLEKFQKDINDLILTFSLTILNRRTQASTQSINREYNTWQTCEIDVTGLDISVSPPAANRETFQSVDNVSASSRINFLGAMGHSVFSVSDFIDRDVEDIVVPCEMPFLGNEVEEPMVLNSDFRNGTYVEHFNGFQQQAELAKGPYQYQPYILRQQLGYHDQSNGNQQQTCASAAQFSQQYHANVSNDMQNMPVVKKKPVRRMRKRKGLSEGQKKMMLNDIKTRTAEVKVHILTFDSNGKTILPKEEIRQLAAFSVSTNTDIDTAKPEEPIVDSQEDDKDLENVAPRAAVPNSNGSTPSSTSVENVITGYRKSVAASLSKPIPIVPNPLIRQSISAQNQIHKTGSTSKIYNDKLEVKRSDGNHIEYKCHYCPKGFKYLQFLQYHERCHNQKKFKCSKCDKTFTTRHSLTRHANLHCVNKEYSCDSCEYKTKWPSNLSAHIGTHSSVGYKCRYCEKVVKNYASGYGHVRRFHPGVTSGKNCFVTVDNSL